MITGILHKETTPIRETKPHIVKDALHRTGLFLYIGENEEYARQHYGVCNTHAETGYPGAQKTLDKLHTLNLTPDFIFIDLPLNEKAFCDFVLYLHSARWSCMIPIVYNINRRPAAEIRKLDSLSFADELVDIERPCEIPGASHLPHQKSNILYQPSSGISTGKRIFDIIVSASLLTMFLPVIAIITLYLKFAIKSTLITSTECTGQYYKIFRLYQFCMPQPDAHTTQSHKFFFGRILKKAGFCHLPQLFNVLKGDMSIVGVRPIALRKASTLTDNKTVERFNAPAGIIGLRHTISKARQRLNEEESLWLDNTYAREHGFVMDFQILLQTPFTYIFRVR